VDVTERIANVLALAGLILVAVGVGIVFGFGVSLIVGGLELAACAVATVRASK
jgi:hypothetical protein